MTDEQGEVKEIAVEYRMSSTSDGRGWIITPVLHALSSVPRLLIASLEIDGHELVPSCRIDLKEGDNRVKLPVMRVLSPPGCELENGRIYQFVLKIHSRFGVELILEQHLPLG